MRYLIYLGHPSHYYVFREIRNILISRGNEVVMVIKPKDVLEDLLKQERINYHKISSRRRNKAFISIALDVVIRNIRIFFILKKRKINIVLTCGSDIALLVSLCQIPLLLFNDDDYYIVPKSFKYGWPFVTKVFAPASCNMGKYEIKTIHYKGYQKSFYLQENIFSPDKDLVLRLIGNKRFFLIRVVGLDAHHDSGVEGISEDLLCRIISILQPHGRVIISTEKKLPDKFEKYLIRSQPQDIHHIIYQADLLIADSQSMVHEAALLGTPSIRYNSFVGKIGVLEELEHRFGLTIGIKAGEETALLKAIQDVLGDADFKQKIRFKLQNMNKHMIDVNDFVLDYLNKYYDNRRKI